MSESKVYDSIMKEITAGLTGDPSKDMPYLQAKCAEYKEHEFGKEIIRACGRLMYDMIPDDKKEELKKVMQKDSLGIESALKEIKTNISEKNLEKALKNAESLVSRVEAANLYQDDQVSEYHQFNEFFEEALYGFLYKPTKQLRRAEQIPYTEIYMLYGSLLVEFKRFDEARKALKTGLRWNPIDFSIMSEYVETYKMEGNMDTFFEKTIDSFKIAIHAPYLARCYRNLGYYFVEKKLYSEALSVYLLSMRYEKDSKQAQSEIHYIQQVSGGINEPTFEDIKNYSEKYGFPVEPNKDVLGLAYTYGKHFMDKGEANGAKYCFNILYELTHDEKIKKMIDSISAQ